MLKVLSIKNYALIDAVEIEWDQGLNVITGETGAGKSIVIDALTLILGQRGNKNNIRRGAQKMTVQGVFEVEPDSPVISRLEEMAVEMEDDSLILTRTIDVGGKNVCRANGLAITVSQLKELGRDLVDIHSQHENNSLFQNAAQRSLLDAYGGEAVGALLEQTRTLALELRDLRKVIVDQERDEHELARQKEMCAFELEDIRKAALVSGEDDQLEKERRILENGEKLFALTQESHTLLSGDETEDTGLLSAMVQVMDAVEKIGQIDDTFKPYRPVLEESYQELEDLTIALRDYLDGLDFNAARLDEVEKRLSLIDGLKRKYGATVDEILAYEARTAEKYDQLDHHDDYLAGLKKEYKDRWTAYKEAAGALHGARVQTAARLKTQMEGELADLAMEKARFEIEIKSDGQIISTAGFDQIGFLISVNPGMPPRPLKTVASGGEISRIMLAIKSIFGSMDQIETMIFDEIDTGISGRTAQVVAEKIMAVSRGRQVICISHLPQIAAMADRHYYVEKQMDDDSVEVTFECLTPEESRNELARMLSGAEVTQKSLDHAQEMLEMTKKLKNPSKIAWS